MLNVPLSSAFLMRSRRIATELKALGFRTEVATGQKDQFRLQDMELIATDNVDCIALDSVAGAWLTRAASLSAS